MNIAIVDVAAESGGALSVLSDFVKCIEESTIAAEHKWFLFTSFVFETKSNHICNVPCPEIKKSWIHRLKWENITAKNIFKKHNIDVIFSLQNTGFLTISTPQVVYFHNVLLLENPRKYSLIKKEETKYAIYTRLIAPYTLKTLNKANTVIITQTNTVKKRIEARLKYKNGIVVRPNVNLPLKVEFQYKKSVKGIFYPAAAVPFKQFEELISCVRKKQEWFNKNKYEVIITLNGTENAYAAMIAKMVNGIKCIKMVGYLDREKVLENYKRYALFINSEMESFPLLFLEAQYYGCPIIAGNYAYAVDILSGVNNTFIFKKHNIDDMFEKIKMALNSTIEGPNVAVANENTWKKVEEIIISAGNEHSI